MPDTLDAATVRHAGDYIGYPKEIATAIAQVMGADLYVQKRGRNQFHGYKFATVGDLLDKLQPLMAEAGLAVFQHELETAFIDNGNVMAVRYQFTLAHTSGAVWPEKPVHTGMSVCRNTKGGFDDKAANKCHTAARKYFLLGLFQVPTGEDFRQPTHDGDADGGDHAPPPPEDHDHAAAKPPGRKPPPPKESDDVAAAREYYKGVRAAIKAAPHEDALDSLLDVSTEKLAFIEKHAGAEARTSLLGLADSRRGELRGEPVETTVLSGG